ncbi:MAG TPA: hypothetical protein PKC18_04545, partial [Lacipirellulaceae bacterium]|nr:hypothetical protein [Lacipirellulaceae bacterium]
GYTLGQVVEAVAALYHEQPSFHRRRFFHGKSLHGTGQPELVWLEPSGVEMSNDAWNAPYVRCLGLQMAGGKIDVDEYGDPIIGDAILILFNADHAGEIEFTLPPLETGKPWHRRLDTALDDDPDGEDGTEMSSGKYALQRCSMAVFTSPVPSVDEHPVLEAEKLPTTIADDVPAARKR